MQTKGKNTIGRFAVEIDVTNNEDLIRAENGDLDPAKVRRAKMRITTMTNTNAVQNDTPATPPAATPGYSDAATQALTALETIASLVPSSPARQNILIPYVRRRQAVKRQLIAGAASG